MVISEGIEGLSSRLVNHTGAVFGRLIVLRYAGRNKWNQIVWQVQCECGKLLNVRAGSLVSGHTKSCGCLHKENLIGKKFGKLIVKESMGCNKHKQALYLCACDCGSEKDVVVSSGNLKMESVKSCGCLKSQRKQEKIQFELLKQVFGRLRVLSFQGVVNHQSLWKCYCDSELGGCGSYKNVLRGSLVTGDTKSCGCLFLETHSGEKHPRYKGVGTTKYMLGRIYGYMRVVEKLDRDEWSCYCDPALGGCGNTVVRGGGYIRGGCLVGDCGCKSRAKKRGAGNPAWAGGYKALHAQIRCLSEYDTWRLGVFRKDNFTCQGCKKLSSGDLQAHHSVPLRQLVTKYKIKTQEDAISCIELWDIANGVSLCVDCHKQEHSKC